jgi:hypothetical protein
MKYEGKLFGLKVMSSEWVDKDTIYLMNPKQLNVVVKMENFKPDTWFDKTKRYFSTLWRALKGKL